MKAQIIWEWSNLPCTTVFKDKVSSQVFPIMTSSGMNLSPGLCWKMMREQTPCDGLAQGAGAIASVSCSQRGGFTCHPSWRQRPQQQEADILHHFVQTFPCGPSPTCLTGNGARRHRQGRGGPAGPDRGARCGHHYLTHSPCPGPRSPPVTWPRYKTGQPASVHTPAHQLEWLLMTDSQNKFSLIVFFSFLLAEYENRQ